MRIILLLKNTGEKYVLRFYVNYGCVEILRGNFLKTCEMYTFIMFK